MFLTVLSKEIQCFLIDFNTRYHRVKLTPFWDKAENAVSQLNVAPNAYFSNEEDKSNPIF